MVTLSKAQIRKLYGLPVDEAGNVYVHGRSIKFATGAKRKRTARIIDHDAFGRPIYEHIRKPAAPVIEPDVQEIIL